MGGLYLNNVKKYRKSEGLSQLELAKKVNVARQTINLIENNKYNPSLALCIELAKALKTDLNSLFWEGD
ncbi:Transcription regulator, probable-related protein [Bacillus thuringiensis IBL 200]|nr:Transcription regulator, probable-related protein [Bacillus thuringiensis IBL 200]